MVSGSPAVTEDEMATYRQLGSRLEGHPTPDIPWVDVATGSLGQGLPIAVGVALAEAGHALMVPFKIILRSIIRIADGNCMPPGRNGERRGQFGVSVLGTVLPVDITINCHHSAIYVYF